MCPLASQAFDALDLLCSDRLTAKGLYELVLGCRGLAHARKNTAEGHSPHHPHPPLPPKVLPPAPRPCAHCASAA